MLLWLDFQAVRAYTFQGRRKIMNCRQCGKDDLPLNQQSGLCVRCAIDNEAAKGSPMEEIGSGRGLRIKHETESGQCQTVEAHYNETGMYRLDLVIDGHNVYLTENETGYFLAWMATWYDQGGD
jgi:hypothetical protein